MSLIAGAAPALHISLAMTRRVLPAVQARLEYWKQTLNSCPDRQLRRQALASLQNKRFHAQGGAVFALCAPLHFESLLSIIVALQTISDYLDNLCDRAGYYDARAFFQLHHATLDALLLHREAQTDYYRYFPYSDDGGYLKALVAECRRHLEQLPSYSAVRPHLLRLASLYNELQVYKHIDPGQRLAALQKWFAPFRRSFPGLYWWEFAAACGSTLAIFALLALATRPQLPKRQIITVLQAYFPWICALHILLDYFIDEDEDHKSGDLNFVSYYRNRAHRQERLEYFVNTALQQASRLPRAAFHSCVVKGLLALYLSDSKVQDGERRALANRLLSLAGKDTQIMYRICRILRNFGRI
jgi:tetraprenyl-beta-curcumene synthase